MAVDTDILIVGAGPTGLALARAVAQAGIECLVIDQLEAGHNTSRALVVHAYTLEQLEKIGVGESMAAEGHKVPRFSIRDRDDALLNISFAQLPTRYPFALMIPQSRTEAILMERCHEIGIDVLRPYRLTKLQSGFEAATATIEDGNGHTRILRARFVVGADGMHSTVREQAGIPFVGGTYQQSFVLADVRMRWPLSREEVTLFFSPDGLVVVAPMPGDLHRIVATVDTAPERPSRNDVQRLVSERGPTRDPAIVTEVIWGSRFRIHHKIADRYCRGRILLAGDAAHVHSPAGGQGMNTGLQDALSLAAHLEQVIKNRVDAETAFGGYERDRRAVAEQVRALSNRLTRAATIRNRAGQTIRNGVLRLLNRSSGFQRRFSMDLAALNQRSRARSDKTLHANPGGEDSMAAPLRVTDSAPPRSL